jgi:PPOX class probable F420-dependent enzyme
MRKDLGIEGLGDLVELPLCATLATYRKDGSVVLSPVWHEWRDGGFSVVIERDDIKARHIKRDPRASLAVYESDPPYRGVELRGSPRLVDGGVVETFQRIAVRYLGREAGEAYAAAPSGREIILRLEPGDLRTWDYGEDF